MDRDPNGLDPIFQRVRGEISDRDLKRAAKAGLIVSAFVIFTTLISSSLVPYTEFLWFKHDARHPEVFATSYSARGILFLASFFLSWLILYFSVKIALGASLVFLRAPENRGQVLLTNVLSFVQAKGAVLIRLGAPVFAFLTALGFANEWNTWLLASHAQTFGQTDPTFGLDLGFFVFKLPWYRAVANFGFSLLLLTTAITIAVYAGIQAMAAMAKVELGRPQVRLHLHILIASTLFVFAIQTWLKTYEAGLVDSSQFTGAGYAGIQALAVQRIFAILVLIVAVGTLVNARVGKPYAVPTRGGIGLAVAYVLGLMVYPSLVQRLVVDPDRLTREAAFAGQAIKMTRFAYGLDQIEIRDLQPTGSPTSQEVANSQATLSNVRLWDPSILQTALEGIQGIRPYYTFSDVDVDRYTIDGKPTMLMLAPRQINLDGLGAEARNWANERLRFTHGYGIAVSRVDQATPDGGPVLLSLDIPQKTTPELPITEPRTYYGDARDANGQAIDEYAIVDTGQAEFDFPGQGTEASHRWTGDRGIPIGGLLSRLAFSIVLGDGNLLVSPNVSGRSRLLMRRNVLDRATRLYPFLHFDQDPYVVLLNGRMVWILDGYTTTEMIPYSAHAGDVGSRLNYIRNSVKVTVDAYSGETTAFAVTENEPLLEAYRAIYPGLVRPASEIPAGLAAHFRYPEDMLTLQSALFGAYHVTDPTLFLSNGDVWNIAQQINDRSVKEAIRPFYVEMRLPDAAKAEFVQILPFTPVGKINMSGWLAAHCDPAQYGKVTLYRLGSGKTIAGPEQIEATFNANPEVANINRQFRNGQSDVRVGNLLVIPIGKSFLYSETLFLVAKTPGLQAVPSLRKVLLATNDRVAVGDTYQQALQSLFGSASNAPEPEAPTPAGQTAIPKSVSLAPVREALGLLDQADAALRAGDFAKFGDLQKQAREKLRALAH